METMKVEEIRADPSSNIRRSSEADEELVASVKAQGVLEPLLVRQSDKRLIVGFRRLAAAAEASCSCNAVRVDERSTLPDRVMVTCWYCKTEWPSYKAWYYRPASGRVRTVVV